MIAAPNAPDWLVARPIAHRGLHRRDAGIVENSLSAALAAVDRGFAIECDVQLTADGDAVVFHDGTLDRLTAETGPVASRSGAELGRIALAGSADAIPSLSTFLDRVGARVPVVCEVKSRFDGDTRLADRVAEIAAGYAGPFAVKSFDPDVITHLRGRGSTTPLGIVAEASYDHAEWSGLTEARRRDLAQLLHVGATSPDFLSYAVKDLPHGLPNLFRVALGRPVMTWTVRTPEQRHMAARWSDQMVFEGFVP